MSVGGGGVNDPDQVHGLLLDVWIWQIKGIDPSVTDLQEATAIITREADLDLPARVAYVNYRRVT